MIRGLKNMVNEKPILLSELSTVLFVFAVLDVR